MEKKKSKVGLIIEIIVLSLFVLGFAFLIVMQIIQPELELSIWMKENILDVSTIGETVVKHIPVLITSTFWIIVIYAISRILRIIFKARMEKSDRLKTVFSLLDGFVKYGCAIAIIILILQVVGVDPAALIASVGVLTLVVGLGAQPLIADIIAGIFIIFENEYNDYSLIYELPSNTTNGKFIFMGAPFYNEYDTLKEVEELNMIGNCYRKMIIEFEKEI